MYDVINMPDLVVRYFSSTIWLVVFIVSIIYLFIRLNTAKKRAMLFAVIVFFLFINAFVIRLFTNLGQNSTYYRHLWAIPSIAVVGIAVIDLIRIIPKWYLKVSMIAALAIGLWFVNGQEYIRCRTQILSTNTKLIPEDVIELGDRLEELRKESGKNILFVICPNGYARPYGNMVTELGLYSGFINVSDSSVLTDEDHNGETELMGDNPDIEHIMSTCCARGLDYVIISNNEGSEKKLKTAGFIPEIKTKSFSIYKCEGYAGYRLDYTVAGLLSWKSWYDKDGEPSLNDLGYCTEKYTYNGKGLRLTDCYYDIDGAPCVDKYYGCARIERKYTMYGDLEEERLYDADGIPCTRIDHGYSIIRNFYSGRRLLKKCYYNDKGELFNYDGTYPRAIVLYFYDEHGNCISKQAYDKDGNSSQSLRGFDEIRWTYDENHRVLCEGYYCKGLLCNRSDTGYAEKRYEYDQSGALSKEEYYDMNGQKVEIPSE